MAGCPNISAASTATAPPPPRCGPTSASNLVLLLASDYFAVLMISNVCYLMFNFLNLQSGWIHRIDRPDWERPFRCPTWLLATGAAFGFVNMAFMGAGADVWGSGTLRNGLIAVTVIVPVFLFRPLPPGSRPVPRSHAGRRRQRHPPRRLAPLASAGGLRRRGHHRACAGPDCVAGIRYQVSGIRYQGSGIRDQGSGIRDQGSGIRDQGSGDQGSGIRDQGSGIRYQNSSF